MSGVRSLLNIAKSALFSNQAGVNTAGHNIANVNTEGYSKQDVQLYNIPGVMNKLGIPGDGVDVSGIEQRQTKFADQRMFQENSRLGHWEAREKTLQQIEGLFYGVGENDINVMMNNFFNAWEDVSNNPESPEFRTEVVQVTKELTDKFHNMDTSFGELRTNLNEEVKAKVRRVNEILHEVYEYNDRIAQLEYNGAMANDLRDRRRLLVRELSGMMDVQIQETKLGKLQIAHQGVTLVGQDDVFEMTTKTEMDDGFFLTKIFGNGREFSFKSGEIAGILDARDTNLKGYQDTIDGLASEVVQQVNKIHNLGFDLNGNLGGDFFQPGKLTAGTIEIRSDLEDNLDRIAAAGGDHDWALNIHTSHGVGSNNTALRLAELRYIKFMKNDTSTFEQVYTALYADVGFDSKEAQTNKTSTQMLVDQIDNYREGISNVSLDEEVMAMMNFQNSYAAASKLVTIADDMFKTILQMTR
ncbi:MAG: flagellar hook-associated protein FlgK [Candidatus Marinimicrobia bacterium]|nr:flagellar hook-associated protein FlgK [Candidatus Neomarinimicrobiota bacterium]